MAGLVWVTEAVVLLLLLAPPPPAAGAGRRVGGLRHPGPSPLAPSPRPHHPGVTGVTNETTRADLEQLDNLLAELQPWTIKEASKRQYPYQQQTCPYGHGSPYCMPGACPAQCPAQPACPLPQPCPPLACPTQRPCPPLVCPPQRPCPPPVCPPQQPCPPVVCPPSPPIPPCPTCPSITPCDPCIDVKCPSGPKGFPGPPGPPCSGLPGPPGLPGQGLPGPRGIPGPPGKCDTSCPSYPVPTDCGNNELYMTIIALVAGRGCCERDCHEEPQECPWDISILMSKYLVVKEKIDLISKLNTRIDLLVAAILRMRVSLDRAYDMVGDPGSPGEEGDHGDRGDKGPTGEPGQCPEETCLVGPAGKPGPAGEPGEQGPKGECCHGTRGPRGHKGPPGKSTPGLPGLPGLRGDKGDPGRASWSYGADVFLNLGVQQEITALSG
nr:collagen alpha-1(XVI) chain-like [Procambarus clarkii]